MMLLGMILFRKGILSADKSIKYYKKMVLVGFVPGLILSIIGLNQAYDFEWSGAYVMNIGANYKLISGFFMAIGYIGLVMWFFKKGIFNGLGFFGTFDRLQQFLVVISVWVLILILSPLVLKKYKFGPLEWMWRKLTYFS